jgi:hypothetical protein
LSITKYTRITLNIPVCNSCAIKKFLWFGGLVVSWGLMALLAGYQYSWNVPVELLFLLALVGFGCGIVGIKAKPIEIFQFKKEENLLAIKIYNDLVAKAMLSSNKSELIKYKPVRNWILIAGVIFVAIPAGLLMLAVIMKLYFGVPLPL